MAKEIERKYLLLNDGWKINSKEGIKIKQGYLNSNKERTVRVRIINERGVLTIKSKNIGIIRNEFEYEIPFQEAKELMKICEKPIIEKTQYLRKENGLTWEIDIFEGQNKGLEIAEVELNSEKQKIEAPSWLGRGVSDDVKYYNSNLIQNPYTTWEKD